MNAKDVGSSSTRKSVPEIRVYTCCFSNSIAYRAWPEEGVGERFAN
jgi:hypothetical protein